MVSCNLKKKEEFVYAETESSELCAKRKMTLKEKMTIASKKLKKHA
jgi:hypothetical protein